MLTPVDVARLLTFNVTVFELGWETPVTPAYDAVITCGLAELAVTETEQAETPVPAAASAQLAGVTVSVEMEEENETEPVGDEVTPGDVAETVAVTVTGWPTTGAPSEELTAVDVVPAVTVRVAVPVEVLCVVLPA